jgi:prevent-host-death family protein
VAVRVGIRELRASLTSWLDRARDGEELIVTERGKPIARISAYEGQSKLEELIARGLVTPAKKPRRPIDRRKLVRMPPGKTLADIVVEQRRGARY